MDLFEGERLFHRQSADFLGILEFQYDRGHDDG
jgi:hypothetical protein